MGNICFSNKKDKERVLTNPAEANENLPLLDQLDKVEDREEPKRVEERMETSRPTLRQDLGRHSDRESSRHGESKYGAEGGGKKKDKKAKKEKKKKPRVTCWQLTYRWIPVLFFLYLARAPPSPLPNPKVISRVTRVVLAHHCICTTIG